MAVVLLEVVVVLLEVVAYTKNCICFIFIFSLKLASTSIKMRDRQCSIWRQG